MLTTFGLCKKPPELLSGYLYCASSLNHCFQIRTAVFTTFNYARSPPRCYREPSTALCLLITVFDTQDYEFYCRSVCVGGPTVRQNSNPVHCTNHAAMPPNIIERPPLREAMSRALGVNVRRSILRAEQHSLAAGIVLRGTQRPSSGKVDTRRCSRRGSPFCVSSLRASRCPELSCAGADVPPSLSLRP